MDDLRLDKRPLVAIPIADDAGSRLAMWLPATRSPSGPQEQYKWALEFLSRAHFAFHQAVVLGFGCIANTDALK